MTNTTYCSDCDSLVSLETGEEYCPECGAYLFDADGAFDDMDGFSEVDYED